MHKTKLAAGAMIVALGTFTSTVANAAPGDLVVTGGTLDFDPAGAPALGTFAGITLNGQPQLTRAALAPFTIIDARGTSGGWSVSLSIDDLVNGLDTIPATNLSMTAATVIDSSTGAAAATVAGIDVASFVAATPTAIVTAGGSTPSNGTFLVSPKILKLVVPADALIGTYTTTATLTVA